MFQTFFSRTYVSGSLILSVCSSFSSFSLLLILLLLLLCSILLLYPLPHLLLHHPPRARPI